MTTIRIAAAAGLLLLAATVIDADLPAAQTSAKPVHSSQPLPTPRPPDKVRRDTIGTAERPLGCLIQPHASADVAAGAPGVLAEVRVERGAAVTKGQVLAVLDHDVEEALLSAASARAETQAEIATAQATRAMAEKKVERLRALTKLNYGAQLELEMAEGELAVAITQLQQTRDRHRFANRDHRVAEQQLGQRFVRSPIDGVVADRLLNPGERADGRPIVRIITLDRLRVEVIAPADRFGQIQTGMPGSIQPENGSAPVTATVEQVDRFIDAASGTFRARLQLANTDLAIPAGIRCQVSFATGNQPVAESGTSSATQSR